MKIRYLQLAKPLNLPGIGIGSKKLTANGLDTNHNGCVKTIEEASGGYVVHIPAGHHKGHYLVPHGMVEHAGVELDMNGAGSSTVEQAKAVAVIDSQNGSTPVEGSNPSPLANRSVQGVATDAAPKAQRKSKTPQA